MRMAARSSAAAVLRSARRRAGLSQRRLARRAATTQSVVARIESGETSPRWDTLRHLLRAAGFELRAEVIPRPRADSHMMDDVARILRLSPEDRLREVAALNRFVAATHRA
jgi:predicted transcriptional regulator